MADRYWVGGTGNWDASTTTHWATASGAAGGASVPTAADRVFIDANSGTGTITVTATANCLDLSMVGYTGTFAGSSALNIAGSAEWKGTVTFSGLTTYTATATGKTIKTNGITRASNVVFNGVGGGWTLLDAMTTTGTVTLTNGAFSDGGFSLTTANFLTGNANVRSLTKNASWTLTGTGTVVDFGTVTNLTKTFDATKNWTLTYSGATTTGVNFGGLAAVGNLKFTAGSYSNIMTGMTAAAGCIGDLDFTGFSGSVTTSSFTMTGSLTVSATMTVPSSAQTTTMIPATGTTKNITSNGVSWARPITLSGVGSIALLDALNTGTNNLTLTSGGFSDGGFTLTVNAFSSNNSNVRSVTKSANWFLSGSGNCVNFNVATNLTATFDSTKSWSFTNSGSALVQPIFPSTFTSLGSLKVTAGTYSFDPLNGGVASGTGSFVDVDFTGFSGSLAGRAITFSGNFIVSATMTFISTSTSLQPMGTGAQTIRSNGVTLNHAISVNCTGTFKPLDALNVGAQQISVVTGTFDDNGFTLTMGTFASSGTGVRTVNKSVDWTITGTGAVTNFNTVTNLTVNFDTTKSWVFSNATATTLGPSFSSAIGNVGHAKITGSTGTVTLGGASATGTYNDIDFTGSSCALGTSSVTLTGSLTLSATMTCTDVAAGMTFLPPAGTTKFIRSNGVAFNHSLTISGPGTTQLLDAITLSATSGIFNLVATGAFDDGGFSVTCQIFAVGGALTRSLNQSGPWTLTGKSGFNTWNANSNTNLTLNSSNTITLTNADSIDQNFVGGGFNYPSLVYASGARAGNLNLSIGTSATVHTFGSITDSGTAAHSIIFGAGWTYNFGAFQVAGSAGNLVTLQSSTPGTQYTVNKTGGGNVASDYLSVTDMVGGPGYPWFMGAHSVNGGNNLGVAFCTAANASMMELAA